MTRFACAELDLECVDVTREGGRLNSLMTTSTMPTEAPSSMLPEVPSKVAGMGPLSLQAVHRFIDLMELNALAEETKNRAGGLRLAGKLEPALLEVGIREHHRKHG